MSDTDRELPQTPPIGAPPAGHAPMPSTMPVVFHRPTHTTDDQEDYDHGN